MRFARLELVLLFAASWVGAQPARAKDASSISIDSIEADVAISGHATGFAPDELAKTRIVVYVLTDQWYIHPFADGGEGKSWASIRPDGTWIIGTVKREFPAKKVAAILVPSGFAAPPRTQSLVSLPTRALVVRDLVGTPDDGKL